MGLLDKVKAGVKAGAEQAAVKAREELEDLQTKREVGQAYGDLGRKAFELVERGEIQHAELGALVDRVKGLNAKLESPSGSGPADSTP
jgi:hypothetical protein